MDVKKTTILQRLYHKLNHTRYVTSDSIKCVCRFLDLIKSEVSVQKI
jgi:hypothetical protein